MGLSNAISGAIVMVVMLAMMFAFLVIYETSLKVNDAAIDNFDIENKIFHTSISLVSPVASGGSPNVGITIVNDGQEKLWDFSNFEFIVEYDGELASPTRHLETLTYSGTCAGTPPVGNWCINTWNNDVMDPNILNQGESIDIIGTVSDNLFSSGLIKLSVSTDLGVTSTISGTI